MQDDVADSKDIRMVVYMDNDTETALTILGGVQAPPLLQYRRPMANIPKG
jgi:hypothetical protein